MSASLPAAPSPSARVSPGPGTDDLSPMRGLLTALVLGGLGWLPIAAVVAGLL